MTSTRTADLSRSTTPAALHQHGQAPARARHALVELDLHPTAPTTSQLATHWHPAVPGTLPAWRPALASSVVGSC
jgi:hypothetical protein